MNDTPQSTCTASGNPFWAIALIAISLIVILGQNLMTVRDQKTALSQMIEQQKPAMEQSRQVQVRFQKMMMDLLQLAQAGDKDAKDVITKYGIAFTPASAPAPATAPAPAK